MQNSPQSKFLIGCGFFMMILLLCLGGVLVLFGVHEFAEAREYPQPAPIKYVDLVRRKPDHGWFRVSDGVLDVADAVWEESISGSAIKRAFVPLLPPGTPISSRAGIVVETKDPAILELVEARKSAGGSPSANAPATAMRFRVQRPVEGRIPGFNRPGMIAARMQTVGISGRLSPDTVYLAEGESPSSGTGWTFIGIGAGLIALIGVVIVKMIQEQTANR